MAEDRRGFGIAGDCGSTALDPGSWYSTVCEGGCRFVAAWMREEKNGSENWHRKREAAEVSKAEVAPGGDRRKFETF